MQRHNIIYFVFEVAHLLFHILLTFFVEIKYDFFKNYCFSMKLIVTYKKKQSCIPIFLYVNSKHLDSKDWTACNEQFILILRRLRWVFQFFPSSINKPIFYDLWIWKLRSSSLFLLPKVVHLDFLCINIYANLDFYACQCFSNIHHHITKVSAAYNLRSATDPN